MKKIKTKNLNKPLIFSLAIAIIFGAYLVVRSMLAPSQIALVDFSNTQGPFERRCTSNLKSIELNSECSNLGTFSSMKYTCIDGTPVTSQSTGCQGYGELYQQALNSCGQTCSQVASPTPTPSPDSTPISTTKPQETSVPAPSIVPEPSLSSDVEIAKPVYTRPNPYQCYRSCRANKNNRISSCLRQCTSQSPTVTTNTGISKATNQASEQATPVVTSVQTRWACYTTCRSSDAGNRGIRYCLFDLCRPKAASSL